MQRTLKPLPKHASYGNKPTPTLQLLAKLSKFQGERTDDINKRAYDMKTGTNMDMDPSTVSRLCMISFLKK